MLNTKFQSNTVGHFSYAPLFQDPHFLTKMLELNILYHNLLIDILLFDDIEKISELLMRIILLRQRQFWQKCTCNLKIYIFY